MRQSSSEAVMELSRDMREGQGRAHEGCSGMREREWEAEIVSRLPGLKNEPSGM